MLMTRGLTEPDVAIKLPLRHVAFELLQNFEYYWADYHWFLRRDFRERLQLLYQDRDSQLRDRNWLCRVSVVFALSLTIMRDKNGSNSSNYMATSGMERAGRKNDNDNIDNGGRRHHDTPLPPGSDLFEQALRLFSPSVEEPTLGDIESLNLMVRRFNR